MIRPSARSAATTGGTMPGVDVGEQLGQRDLVGEDGRYGLRPHPPAVGLERQERGARSQPDRGELAAAADPASASRASTQAAISASHVGSCHGPRRVGLDAHVRSTMEGRRIISHSRPVSRRECRAGRSRRAVRRDRSESGVGVTPLAHHGDQVDGGVDLRVASGRRWQTDRSG